MNMRVLNLLYIIVSLITFFSCNEVNEKHSGYYPEHTSISNIDGVPNDSLTFYLPDSIKKEGVNIATGLNTFMLNWYSSALYCAKEPILYNYYLRHDIFRFLWLRSFHRPVVFSLHKEKNKVWLTTTMLDKEPEFLDLKHIHYNPPVLEDSEADDYLIHRELIIDSITKADRKATIVLNQTKYLTKKEWNKFESLLEACSFWDMKPYEEGTGFDGSEWIVEGHLKNKYWFVNRWSPEDSFKSVGVYLIETSEMNEEMS